MLGKIDASLDAKLKNVKWGKYKLEELFDIDEWEYGKNKQWISRFKNGNSNRLPVISGITTNNGINYYTEDIPKDSEVYSDSLTISTRGQYSGTVTYHSGKFVLANNILVMSMPGLTKNQKLFIGALINGLGYGGYNNYPRIETLKKDSILLPINNNKEIDFPFMESLISELEEERISELESYLKVSKLDNYILSNEEKKFINYDLSNSIESLLNNKLRSISWKEYKMDDLFERINTKKLAYKAKELPTEPTGKYVLPCLTSSFMNQGLNYYAPIENATILKNVISIPSNSDVYRAYFQSNDFTVLSDAYAICWKDKSRIITENEYLFMTQCINKVTDLPIYSYKNKLGGWNKAKEKKILLPNKDDNIDFDFMDKFILIAKKLIIKDVVEYTNKKLNATKEIVNNKSQK